MRQLLLLATAGLIGMTATGCDFFAGDDTVSQETIEQSPVVVSPAKDPAFSQPTVAAANQPKGILPPDLISSTDPNQRVQQIKGDRSDPFALLPTTPTVQVAKGAVPQTVIPAPATRSTTSSTQGSSRTTSSGRSSAPNRSTASGSSTNGSGGSSRSRTTRVPTQSAPKSPIKATAPRPQPELARAVQVTGVVQVGNKVYAIVNAPNEPTSRYVQAGQRLAGGQVLVRRIETNRAEPVVILEQYGVEVVRAVGEGGAPTTATGTPAATLPVPSIPAT